jgi:hypothetical protein
MLSSRLGEISMVGMINGMSAVSITAPIGATVSSTLSESTAFT